jgi:hypothetical protein
MTTNLVFHPNTQQINIGPSISGLTNLHKSLNSIDTFKDLLKNSPVLISGKLGRSAYSEEPFELTNKVAGQAIFGWKPDAKRQKAIENKFFLVLGAQKNRDQEVVYYAPSDGTFSYHNPSDHVKRSTTDQKIYVTSFKRFKEMMELLFIEEESDCDHFETDESFVIPPFLNMFDISFSIVKDSWIEKFKAFPPESILNSRREECKNLAQQMFYNLKEISFGNSAYAKQLMEDVCNALPKIKGSLERAWDGVGDDSIRWQA